MKLIDKSALVAEINKRITDAPINYIGHQRVWAYNDVKDIIDTIEVKEVDSLSLTWEDMLIIHKCIKDATNSHLSAFQTVEGQQKIYEDVLKRFKAQKG